MFNYKEIATTDRIKNYIRKFWMLDHSDSYLYGEGKHALPNGCFTLAFITGEGMILESGNNIVNVKSGVYFFGQITKRVKVIIRPHTKAIMAQLNPWAPTLITKHPLSELTDKFAELDVINKDLYKALSNINISDEHLLIQKLYHELDDYFHETNDSALLKSIINIFTSSPPAAPLKIADIATETGYSKRYIEKKFSNNIGLSPKELYSILRLRNVVDVLQSPDNNSSLTQLALECGYFDQSHFIKKYTGIMDSLPGKFEVKEYILPLNR